MSDGPQPATRTTFAVYVGPPLETLRSMVASQFQVKDVFLDPYGVPTIQVSAEPVKSKFKALLEQLAQQQLVAAIRGSGDALTIKVFQKPPIKSSRKIINLVLFVATLATVFLAGYFIWRLYAEIVSPGADSYLKAGEFAVGLVAIIGLHEFGHQVAAKYHKLNASLPYFIPGPPPFVPFGTFGALISLREPPANRDQLFDLGLSGPVVGLVVTIVVGLLSIVLGLPLSQDQVTRLSNQGLVASTPWPSEPALFYLLDGLRDVLRPGLAPDAVLFSQLIFATQIGVLLTFLNIIPAWQLDGGHISRAAFGPEGHKIGTVLGVIILILAKYYEFAILMLFLMSFSRRGFSGVEPLDDISPISTSRKVLYALSLIMLGLTFSFSPFR